MKSNSECFIVSWNLSVLFAASEFGLELSLRA